MKHSQGLQRSRVPGFSPYFDRMLQEHDRLRSLLFDGDDDTTATMSEWAPAVDLREACVVHVSFRQRCSGGPSR